MNFESSTVDDSVVFGKFNKYDKNLPKNEDTKMSLNFTIAVLRTVYDGFYVIFLFFSEL